MLISDEYREQLRQLHASARGMGHSGRKHASEILAVTRAMSAGSILDYGCGAGTLATALRAQDWPFTIYEYDPAIAGKSTAPGMADVVVCTDVLEHVEPECLDQVLAHLRRLTCIAAFFVISTVPAHKTLPDGRNAHLIVESPDWWRDRIFKAGFSIRSRFIRADADGVVCEASFWLRPKR